MGWTQSELMKLYWLEGIWNKWEGVRSRGQPKLKQMDGVYNYSSKLELKDVGWLLRIDSHGGMTF